jgi:polyisoprenoid-binding protein YceI
MTARNPFGADGTWRVDPEHSSIEFRVRHLMIESVRGRFLDFDGTIESGEAPLVVATIQASSLQTNHEERDAHLRSPDFLDVDRHPEIRFESTSIDLAVDGAVTLAGDLTIKEVTRPFELVGAYQGSRTGLDGLTRIAFDLRGELNRLDYGLNWNRMLEAGGILVGNTVELLLDVAAVRQVAVEQAA